VLTEARIVYETAKISVPTAFEGALGRLDRATVDRRLQSWGRACIAIAEMTLDVRGKDEVDWSRSYVIMSNHQSLFDIPVLAATVPGSLRFVAKKELFRVPIWGQAMRAAGIISIDRQNRRSAIESLREAGEIIHSGIHIWIAPEGTRSLDGQLGPLKKGGFMLAIDTGTPILPMVISGTHNARRKHERGIQTGVHVEVTFGKPLEVEGRTRDSLVGEVERFFRAHVGDAEVAGQSGSVL
jgi:1-acyl-sn-glycerol-3-phosphate acyltransferase